MAATESKLGSWFSTLGEKLNDQVWFQQLKAKWEEIDPQSRAYLKYASLGLVMLLILGGAGFAWNQVRSIRSDLNQRQDLLTLIEQANEEIRTLRRNAGGGGGTGATNGPWVSYLESTAGNAGIDKTNLTVGQEKPGAKSDQANESLFEIDLKKVNIKQVVRYAYFLENGARPIKLRNLTIDTEPDLSGYLNAKLAISGYTLNQEQ